MLAGVVVFQKMLTISALLRSNASTGLTDSFWQNISIGLAPEI